MIILLFPSFFENLNSKIYDWKLSISNHHAYSAEIVHVDIDDEAIKEFGQWPWDRELSARIVEKLSEFTARVVAFDILFSSPGKTKEGDEAFVKAIKKAGNVVCASGLGGLTDADGKILELPQDRSRVDALYDRCWPLSVPSKLKLLRVFRVQNSALPLSNIIEASRGIGYITATPDKDGVYRKIGLLVKFHDRWVPSLSLSTLMAYWNLTPESIGVNDTREIEIKLADERVRIPLDARGMFLVNWGKPWTSFKHYSVIDVLSNSPDSTRASRYKGKIVIVAVTATGNTDFGITPLSINAPLSRIHSHALNTILMRDFISAPAAFPWIVMFSVLVAVFFPLSTEKLSLKTETILVGLICLGFFVAAVVCFLLWTYDLSLSEFFFILVPATCGALLIRGASIEWQAALAKKALERYLPPEVLDMALSMGMKPDVSMRRQEVTIVFVDIKGFSTLSESVEVEYVSSFLKDFFETMTRAIHNHQGRIHQFLGDGFLAVFGDLIPLENHADAAFKAAMNMQKSMPALNAKWAHAGIKEFKSGTRIRIGINTGMVFVGDLGSDRRLEYNIVGSAVNIASRLQALAPQGGIMITSRTRALLQNSIMCQGPESVKLKGFEKEIEVYTTHPDPIDSSFHGDSSCSTGS